VFIGAAQLLPAFIYFATFTSAKACRAWTGKMSAPAGGMDGKNGGRLLRRLKAKSSSLWKS